MKFKDYYQVMDVTRDATQSDIKRAYRKLARKFHPDVSKASDAEARFKEVGEAYAVLKDPEKRAAYDQLGKDWKQGQDFQPPPDWGRDHEFRSGGFDGSNTSDFGDFFSSLYNRDFGPTTQDWQRDRADARADDQHAKVFIELEDAYNGVTQTITLRTPLLDTTGRLTHTNRSLKVKIPKGITNGQRIRLAGQAPSPTGNGVAGDLYLDIRIATHPIFRVDGRDVNFDVPIAPWEAALGASIKIPTPVGALNLKIPPGTVAGHRLRLKGKGIPGTPAGDLYAIAELTLPPADTENAKRLYLKMQEDLPYNPREKLGV